MEPSRQLTLDDLAVGDVFESAAYEVTEAEIRAFAGQYDPQPFHTDPVAAEGTIFGGLAASGWHTAAITMRLLVGAVPLASGIIGSSVAVEWPSATRPGDVLSVRAVIASITPSSRRPGQARVTMDLATTNAAGETRQRATATCLAYARTQSR